MFRVEILLNIETCKEQFDIEMDIWDEWTSWTQCKYTLKGPQRRRFSDPLAPIPPHFNRSCLLDAVEDRAIVSKSRSIIIVENEFDPTLPRIANVENCTGKIKCLFHTR